MAQALNETLDSALAEVLRAMAPGVEELPLDRCRFGPTRSPDHGDAATSAALALTKLLGRKPLEIAEDIAAALASHPYVASVNVAKPGFVNVTLSQKALADILIAVAEEGGDFGDNDSGLGQSVLLEFVSANPTGPMHLGHCRHAATGDCLARVLRANGCEVTTEFYVNDAGAQVKSLGRSFRLRCIEAVTQEPLSEEQLAAIQYSGSYLVPFAEDFTRGRSLEEVEQLSEDEFAWEARNRNLEQIQRDLLAMGVVIDSYVSERALLDGGKVRETLDTLRASGATYEQEGALWLRTEDRGDDKDRVLVKTDGELTYLVPDLAYHHDKFLRGYDRYINVFGADHSGYPPRLKAGIATLGHDAGKLNVTLLRLVFLTKNGERVKFSKRAGNFVALADVVEEAGADATRWFMLCRSVDTEFEFDMNLATEQSSSNPVFKVQYAHARICSLEKKARERGFPDAAAPAEAVKLLSTDIERAIVLHLARFPEVVRRSGEKLDVHQIPDYLLSLAELMNSYYTRSKTDPSFRVLSEDNPGLFAARKAMLDAVRQVLANGLGLLGISAPVRMTRGEEEA